MKNKTIVTHSELPLEKDGANLFLKIISTISVFLFTITLTGYCMINSLVDSWDKDIVDGFTVQVIPDETDANQTDIRLNKVVNFLENIDGVEKVRVINDKQVNNLLKPWLGNNVDILSLPMPKLIDVRLKKGADTNFDKISEELKQLDSNTLSNSHQIWLNRLLNFAKSIKMVAVGVLFIVLISCSFSIFYATKTSLGIHKNIIEILHIMGATDDYIAKQYAKRSFFIGLISGAIGVVLGACALFFISNYASQIPSGILDKASLDLKSYFSIATIVMFTAIMSMITAYYTVRRTLGKIL